MLLTQGHKLSQSPEGPNLMRGRVLSDGVLIRMPMSQSPEGPCPPCETCLSNRRQTKCEEEGIVSCQGASNSKIIQAFWRLGMTSSGSRCRRQPDLQPAAAGGGVLAHVEDLAGLEDGEEAGSSGAVDQVAYLAAQQLGAGAGVP